MMGLRRVAPAPGARDGGVEGRLHVAVGRSPEKTLGLLRWAFRRFGCREIGLVHVHQPSPVIPTLLGKIPVNQANEELVSNHRLVEKEATKKILLSYVNFCQKAQVQASIIVTETDQIQNGIVDLVDQYGIKKLIMGSTPDKIDSGFSSETEQKDFVYDNLKEVAIEAERSKKAAFAELVKRKQIESEVAEAFARVEASKAAQARETKIREELEAQLLTIKRQREELLNQKDEDVRELESAMRMLAVLDSVLKKRPFAGMTLLRNLRPSSLPLRSSS
uniref:Uncharacterized protein n=1 Tax=Ananas comosus var. bracteatus TaxID=296719 RepID=A0A6V7QUB4_ANACO